MRQGDILAVEQGGGDVWKPGITNHPRHPQGDEGRQRQSHTKAGRAPSAMGNLTALWNVSSQGESLKSVERLFITSVVLPVSQTGLRLQYE